MPVANPYGNPLLHDPNAPPPPSVTRNITNRDALPYQSSQTQCAASTIATPHYDTNASPTRWATITNREAQPPRPPPKADNYGKYEDKEGTQGGRKRVILKKPPPQSKERKESQTAESSYSVDIMMDGCGSRSYSPIDQEPRSAPKATTAPADAQLQSRHGPPQHTVYSPAHIKEKRQSVNHLETGLNVSYMRASDSINSRRRQLVPKRAQLPSGAAEAQLPPTGRYRETQSGEDDSAQPPQDVTRKELQRTKAKLQQLEYEFRRVRGDNAQLQRACLELDTENRRQKDTIQSLQREFTKLTNDPQTTSTDNEPESLSAARAILDGTGTTPLMAIIDAMLVLHKEIANVSNFLGENIRHTSYELFQEELDRCYQDSEKIIGEQLSKSLYDHSEREEFSQSLIKITIQIFITSFCASEWDRYLDTPLPADNNTAKNYKERKAAFLRNLISVFKIAAWVIPGSASRAAFEESLNPFFKSMEEIEVAWTKVPEFTKVSLSFVSPGEDLADFETYAEDATEPEIPTSNEPSPSQNIVLGTVAFGIHCLFRDHNNDVEDKPRIIIAARVILEENLRYIFGIREEQKPTAMSNRSASQTGDGRDP